jgi:hypothetical protein
MATAAVREIKNIFRLRENRGEIIQGMSDLSMDLF